MPCPFRRHLLPLGFLLLLLAGLFARSCDPALTLANGDGSLTAILGMAQMRDSLFTGSWQASAGLGSPGAPYNIAPGYLLIRFLPATKYVDANAILALLITGIAGYVLLHDMTRRRFPALAGALFLMLQPHLLSHLLPGHVGHFVMAAWVAPAFLFTRRALLEGGFVNWVAAGASAGALLAAGQHDVAAFFSLTLAAYGLFLLIRTRAARPAARHWAALAGGAALAALLVVLMAYQALFANLVRQVRADRAVTASAVSDAPPMSRQDKWLWATQWSLPPVEMIDAAVPSFFGQGSSNPANPYRGRIGQTDGWMTHRQGLPNLNDVCQYLGAVTLLGLLAALLFRWRDPEVRFFAGCALLALLLAFGKFGPLYRFFFAIPGMDTLRNPIKWYYVVSWCAGILAALGLARVSEPAEGPSPRRSAALLGALPGLLVLGLGGLLLARLAQTPFFFWQQPALVRRSAESLGLAALFWGLGGFAFFLMLTGRRPGKPAGARQLGMALALGVMAAELIAVNRAYMPYHAWAPETNGGPFSPFLKTVAMPSRFRFLRQDGLFHQLREVAIQQAMEHADPYASRLVDDFHRLQRRLEPTDPIRFWRLCNVRYIVAPAALKSPDLEPRLSLKSGAQTAIVHELKTALPRCVWVSAWRCIPDTEAADQLAAPGFDPGREALVHAPPDAVPPPPSPSASQGRCRISAYAPDKLVAETESDQPGLAVLLTRHDPGWRAWVDGEPVPSWKANGLLQACPVPAGRHRLEWRADAPPCAWRPPDGDWPPCWG